MRYLSVCSGIEAASVAWEPLGWTPLAFAEVDPFASAVLRHRFPGVPNVGDFTGIEGDAYGAVDVLVGGTPCQDFSVAGLREGMGGERGQLTVEFARLAGRLRPRWLVWENVPGVLSSDGGRAFSLFLGTLGQLGYGCAYRILDAQYLGVPQRRRRVFVVGCLGDWRRAAAVLFERHSLSGNPAPRRETREGVAGTLKGGTGERGYPDPSDGNGGGLVDLAGTLEGGSGTRGYNNSLDVSGAFIPYASSSHGGYDEGVGTLRSNGGDIGGCSETIISHALTCHQAKGGDPTTDNYVVTGGFPDSANTLGTGGRGSDVDTTYLAFDTTQVTSKTNRSNPQVGDPCHTLAKEGHAPAIAYALQGGGRTSQNSQGSTIKEDCSFTLNCMDEYAVAFEPRYYTRDNKTGGQPSDTAVVKADASKAGDSSPHVATGMQVRRLGGDSRVAGALAAETGAKEHTYIAFSQKDHGADAGETAPTLRAMEWNRSHANGGGQLAVAFSTKESGGDAAVEVSPPLRAESGDPHMTGRAAVAFGFSAGQSADAGNLGYEEERTPTLRGSASGTNSVPTVAFQSSQSGVRQVEARATVDANNGSRRQNGVVERGAAMAVRRLTPRECERLQGFPDDFTLIPVGRKWAADGPRYRVLGNSMAVPVMRWIGERMAMVDGLGNGD